MEVAVARLIEPSGSKYLWVFISYIGVGHCRVIRLAYGRNNDIQNILFLFYRSSPQSLTLASLLGFSNYIYIFFLQNKVVSLNTESHV
jgi:hypothetical protein